MVSDLPSPAGGGNTSPAFVSFSELFQKHLPFYIAIGMSAAEYYDGDCTLVKAYREADKIQKERRNQEIWLQGLYFYEALIDVAPILVAFPEKGAKPGRFPEEPFPLTEKEAREQKERKDRRKLMEMRERMRAFAQKNNQKKQGVTSGNG